MRRRRSRAWIGRTNHGAGVRLRHALAEIAVIREGWCGLRFAPDIVDRASQKNWFAKRKRHAYQCHSGFSSCGFRNGRTTSNGVARRCGADKQMALVDEFRFPSPAAPKDEDRKLYQINSDHHACILNLWAANHLIWRIWETGVIACSSGVTCKSTAFAQIDGKTVRTSISAPARLYTSSPAQ
jgi:hypothetical protein